MSKVTKARVKATGEIIRVSRSTGIVTEDGKHLYNWYEVETLDSFDEHYWTRLEHQAAIATMQGTLANADLLYSLCKDRGNCPVKVVAIEFANACAHALVEKYKEKEK